MSEAIRGKVWKFGDNIDTDVITPGLYLNAPMEEQRKHSMEAVDPTFAGEVKPGDCIVGGRNFGCGSSRENAPAVLKALGVSCIVAESFGRIFYRNSIAIGLPIMACPGISDAFNPGDELELDLELATVKNATSGKELKGESLPEDILSILAKGGVIPLLKDLQINQ